MKKGYGAFLLSYHDSAWRVKEVQGKFLTPSHHPIPHLPHQTRKSGEEEDGWPSLAINSGN